MHFAESTQNAPLPPRQSTINNRCLASNRSHYWVWSGATNGGAHRINHTVGLARRDETKSLSLSAVAIEGQHSQAIGSNLGILRGPHTFRGYQRRRIDLCELWQRRLVDEQQANRLMILIRCGKNRERIILNCQWNHLILQVRKQFVDASHCRLATIKREQRGRIHHGG